MRQAEQSLYSRLHTIILKEYNQCQTGNGRYLIQDHPCVQLCDKHNSNICLKSTFGRRKQLR